MTHLSVFYNPTLGNHICIDLEPVVNSESAGRVVTEELMMIGDVLKELTVTEKPKKVVGPIVKWDKQTRLLLCSCLVLYGTDPEKIKENC